MLWRKEISDLFPVECAREFGRESGGGDLVVPKVARADDSGGLNKLDKISGRKPLF